MRAKDRDAQFMAFFEAESDKLRRLAVFLTGDADRAADLAQEALVRTYKHWHRVTDDDPGPYARRILVNLVRSAHRRKLVERKHLNVVRVEPAPATRDTDEWLTLARALDALPPMRKAAVVLRFYEDMSEADIARVLDRPLGTIKSDIHRGLAKLRPLLEAGEREAL
jgi:RNA polymerase sigma-70 factor (sigma-E family)